MQHYNAEDIDYQFGEDGEVTLDNNVTVLWSHDEENDYGDVVIYITSDPSDFIHTTLTGVYNRVSYEDSSSKDKEEKAFEISQKIAELINEQLND